MPRLLLIEDDTTAGSFLLRELGREGFEVEWSVDGEDGLARAATGRHDAMVIDRMLPGLDGLEVVRCLREAQVETPILVLTALDEVGERVRGLRRGADDYLAKPFDPKELVARLHALLRRAPVGAERPVTRTVGDLHLDLLSRQATRAGVPIDLKPREFSLLDFLVQHRGRIVTRTMILEQVWGFSFDPKTNFIESHVSRLRAKLRCGDADRELIHTIRGRGYIIDAPA